MADLERKPKSGKQQTARGRLRIGDDWNAITIIALSQSNPLKAIAELVENSIAATARRHGLTIATGNDKDFRRPGLKVFNPFKELPPV